MRAALVFLAYGLFSGTNFIFMKWASATLAPMQVACLRVVFGFLPLALVAWRLGALHRAQWRHLPHFAVMGLVATAFYFVAITSGTARLPSGLAAVLANSNLLFTALLSVAFLKDERFNGPMVAGIAIGFVGIVLMARPWQGAGGAVDLAGVAWTLTSAAVLGASYVYARRHLTPLALPSLALATWQMGVGALALLLTTDLHGMERLLDAPGDALLLVVGAGVLGTGLTYYLGYDLLEKQGMVVASAATYLAPAVALLIGWAVGERFGLLDGAALALIVLGIVLLQFGRQRVEARAEPRARLRADPAV